MPIYPYVYRLDHPVTGEFYIGYRANNKFSAGLDLGQKYFTSSKLVKPRFHEFTYQIIAEFFDKESAYDFEQQLIHDSWGLRGLLNKSCHYNHISRWCFTGRKHTEESKQKMSKSQSKPKGPNSKKRDPMAKDHKIKIGKSNKGKVVSEETKNKIRLARSEQIITHETKTKMKLARKNHPKVCRIVDRKEMFLANFICWLKKN